MGTIRIKAPQMPISKRQKIGKYKEKFPNATANEIAAEFNVTTNQVRSAVKAYQAGDLRRTKPRPKKVSIEKAMETPADKLLENQYHVAAAQLETETNIPADERIGLLKDLFAMRKLLQQVRLESHIKRVDAVVFAALVRKFKPEAVDEDIISIYHELINELKL